MNNSRTGFEIVACPSVITEAMAGQIEQKTGMPVVSITDDGTVGNENEVVIPYLKYPRKDRTSGKRREMRQTGAWNKKNPLPMKARG